MRSSVLAGCGLLALAWGGAARAEVSAQVGAGFNYDDNIFRQSRSFSDLTGEPRSDRSYSLDGQVAAHVTPEDFDATLQLAAGQTWYDRNGRLDNFNYSAEIDAVRASLDGIGINLSALSRRQLSSFADIRQPIRNIQELNSIDVETTLPLTPEFRLVVDPSFTQNTNSSDRLKFNDFRQYGVRAGIGYYSPLGNSVAITGTRRYTDGLRDRPIVGPGGGIVDGEIDLVDTSVDLKVIYAFSPITSVSLFGSYVDRNDKSVLDSDYHGPAGSVTFSYHPRQSLNVELTGGRRLNAQSFLFVDSIRTDFVTLTGTFLFADRFDLHAVADHYRRRFRYDPTLSPGRIDSVDRNYRLEANLGYQLTDTVRLGAGAAHEWRHSSFQFGSFRATTVQLSASYAFGRATAFRNSPNLFNRIAR